MKQKYTNKLINESSPYLLQHAHNPVNWLPWGEEALLKAKNENKPLLISIGYAACHWCHVMEHESFENEEIAQIMNQNFICIKVDREERPDIDNIYMSAVQLIAGNGGWPLNCFALPDGSPFFGGTYFPMMQWKNLLNGISEAYQHSYAKVQKTAEHVKSGIVDQDQLFTLSNTQDFSIEHLANAVKNWKRFFDEKEGGNKGAPKFPIPTNYEFLLHYYYHTRDKSILNHVILSLQKMAKGGIYDHLGGGFARYTVDDKWKVPHFEKMLYDNAQLISLFSNAFKLTGQKRFFDVVQETTDFVIRELKHMNDGFFSSYDADSEGEEGKFYCWQKDEVEQILATEEAKLFCELFNIKEEGNWEGKNIVYQVKDIKELANVSNLEIKEVSERIKSAKQKLFNVRNQRNKPALDDKVLTSWNALMISALVDAYTITKNDDYLQQAIRTTSFIKEKLFSNGILYRNYKNEKVTIPGFLDDYANFIKALIDIYQITFKEEWISLAKKLTNLTIKNFLDSESGMFFYTSVHQKDVLVRKMELNDSVMPASNSVMAINLLKLSKIFYDSDYEQKAEQMLKNMYDNIIEKPYYYTNWSTLLLYNIHQLFEIAITGENVMENSLKFSELFLPNTIIAGSVENSKLPILQERFSKEDKIYVCQNKVCKYPVSTFEEAIDLIKT